MYCKFLKLTSGENLIVSTEDECIDMADKKYIEVSEPVEIHSMKMPYAGGVIESYMMQPWLKMSAKEVLRIPARNVVVVTNVLERAEAQYKQFIIEYDNLDMATEEDVEQALSGDDDNGEIEISEEDENDSRSSSGAHTLH